MFEEEKAVVKRWVGLLAGNKDEVWDGFDQVLDPKMTWTVPGKTCVSGTHSGLEAINTDFFGKCWSTNGYCWIITVRNGRIVELHEWCDTMMFETAMFDKKLVPAEDLADSTRSRPAGAPAHAHQDGDTYTKSL
jgi:hypothetical protein